MAVATDSIFRPIVTGYDVEQVVMGLFKRWFGTYLSEVERQHERPAGYWQRPRSYTRTMSFDKFPEDQLPAIILISSGLAEQPRRGGDGSYNARWLMLFGCLCSARTQQDAHDMAHDYAAAVHTLMVQKPSLDGHADGLTWLYDRTDDLAHSDIRSLASCTAGFSVQVNGVASAYGGPVTPDEPLDPDTLPWPDWPRVKEVDVVVDQPHVEHHEEGGSTR